MIVFNEHGVVMDSIKEVTANGNTLQMIREIMRKGNWEVYKDRPDINPFYLV